METTMSTDILSESIYIEDGSLHPSRVIAKELVKLAPLENIRYLCICVPLHCSSSTLSLDEDATNWQRLLVSILRNIHAIKQEATYIQNITTSAATSAASSPPRRPTSSSNQFNEVVLSETDRVMAQEFQKIVPIVCPIFYHDENDIGDPSNRRSSFHSANSLKAWLLSHFPNAFNEIEERSIPNNANQDLTSHYDNMRRSSSASTVAWYSRHIASQQEPVLDGTQPRSTFNSHPASSHVKLLCARKVYYPINDHIYPDSYHLRTSLTTHHNRQPSHEHNNNSNIEVGDILEDCAVSFYLLPIIHQATIATRKTLSPIDVFFECLCCSLGNTVDYVMMVHNESNHSYRDNGLCLQSDVLGKLWRELVKGSDDGTGGRCLMSTCTKSTIVWPPTTFPSRRSLPSAFPSFSPCRSSPFLCLRGSHHHYGSSHCSSRGRILADRRHSHCSNGCLPCFLSFFLGPALLQGFHSEVTTMLDEGNKFNSESYCQLINWQRMKRFQVMQDFAELLHPGGQRPDHLSVGIVISEEDQNPQHLANRSGVQRGDLELGQEQDEAQSTSGLLEITTGIGEHRDGAIDSHGLLEEHKSASPVSHPMYPTPGVTVGSFSMRTTLISASSNSPLLPASPNSNYTQYHPRSRAMSLSDHQVFYSAPSSPTPTPMPSPFSYDISSPQLTTPLNPSGERLSMRGREYHQSRHGSTARNPARDSRSSDQSGTESGSENTHARHRTPPLALTLAQQRSIFMSSLQHQLRMKTWARTLRFLLTVCTPARCEGSRIVLTAIIHTYPETTWQGYLLQKQTDLQNIFSLVTFFLCSQKARVRLKTRSLFSSTSTGSGSLCSCFSLCVAYWKKPLKLWISRVQSLHSLLLTVLSPAIAGTLGYIAIHACSTGAVSWISSSMFQWATESCIWHLDHPVSSWINSDKENDTATCMMRGLDLYLVIAFVIFMYWTLAAHVLTLPSLRGPFMATDNDLLSNRTMRTTGGSARLSGHRDSSRRLSHSPHGHHTTPTSVVSSGWIFEVVCHFIVVICVLYVIPIYIWVGDFIVNTSIADTDIKTMVILAALKVLILLVIAIPLIVAIYRQIQQNRHLEGAPINTSKSVLCSNILRSTFCILSYYIVYGSLIVMQHVFVPYFGIARMFTFTTLSDDVLSPLTQSTRRSDATTVKYRQARTCMKRWNVAIIWILLVLNMVLTILAIHWYLHYRSKEDGEKWLVLAALVTVITICLPHLLQWCSYTIGLFVTLVCRILYVCFYCCCCGWLCCGYRHSQIHAESYRRYDSHDDSDVGTNNGGNEESNGQIAHRSQARDANSAHWSDIRVTVTDEEQMALSPSTSLSPTLSPTRSPSNRQHNHGAMSTTAASRPLPNIPRESTYCPPNRLCKENLQAVPEKVIHTDQLEVESKTDSDIPWFSHPHHIGKYELTSPPRQLDKTIDPHIGAADTHEQEEPSSPGSIVTVRLPAMQFTVITTAMNQPLTVPSSLTSTISTGTTVSSIGGGDDHRNCQVVASQMMCFPVMVEFQYDHEPGLTIHHLPIFHPTISPTNNPLVVDQ